MLDKKKENTLLLSKLQNSLNILMQLILFPIPLCNKLTKEDWIQLFNCMDILYGKTLKNWLIKYSYLSKEEMALCYFCWIGIEHTNLATFFCISPQSLSKRKQRLKVKLQIPQGMSLEEVTKTLK